MHIKVSILYAFSVLTFKSLVEHNRFRECPAIKNYIQGLEKKYKHINLFYDVISLKAARAPYGSSLCIIYNSRVIGTNSELIFQFKSSALQRYLHYNFSLMFIMRYV